MNITTQFWCKTNLMYINEILSTTIKKKTDYWTIEFYVLCNNVEQMYCQNSFGLRQHNMQNVC